MPEFIRAIGIYYRSELNAIKKSGVQLQPVYEAFSNAWESIIERFSKEKLRHGKIRMEFHYTMGLFQDDAENQTAALDKIIIIDNGVGINPASYNRLLTLRDNSKSASNKGTGRIQFAHYFDETTFDSMYSIDEHHGKHIIMTLSKKEAFLNNNAILRKELEEDVTDWQPYTKVTLNRVLDEKKDGNFFSAMSLENIVFELKHHFLARLCESRTNLPTIELVRFEDNVELEPIYIQEKDIPTADKTETINVKYSKLDDQNKVIDTDRTANFTLMSFVLHEDVLSKNSIYYVSNGALAQEKSIDGLPKKDSIDGNRYMFLLSGEYFDHVDDDLRGNLHLVKEADFKKQNESNLFAEEELLVDNIISQTNGKISEIYPVFSAKREETLRNLDELQSMFLIDEKSIESFRKKVKFSDSDAQILSMIYKTEIEETARRDAEIKAEFEKVKALKPDKYEYQQQLKEHVEAFTKLVPIQNRTNLTKYIARRKLVLEIFNTILENEKKNAKETGTINEDVLHNLIFRQKTENNDPGNNDMWLLNDEYIYFSGTSDLELKQIEIAGTKLLKQEMSKEEEDYLVKAGHDGGKRRPDIFLFPKEGRCIIVEFKAPDVDVANHLHQINRYARLINNLSDSSFGFCKYYGYLIGENIDIEEIRDSDPYFQEAPNLGYIYKPYLPIPAKFGRKDGSLYTEVIKYSDILERAQHRNQIFIDKLDGK
jgi:hypothetical protein